MFYRLTRQHLKQLCAIGIREPSNLFKDFLYRYLCHKSFLSLVIELYESITLLGLFYHRSRYRSDEGRQLKRESYIRLYPFLIFEITTASSINSGRNLRQERSSICLHRLPN